MADEPGFGCNIDAAHSAQGVRGKSINVNFRNESLVATVQNETVVSGRLYAPVVASECLWELDAEKSIVTLHLEKQSPAAWPCLISEPLIDGQITTLDPCSAFALCLLLEQLQTDTADRSFALLKYAAASKLDGALHRLFRVLSGRDLYYDSHRDLAAAVALADQPPLSDSPECQYFLARFYAAAADDTDDWWRGRDYVAAAAPRDLERATRLLERAVAQKWPPAVRMLADILRDARKLPQALAHYEALARTDASAHLRIAGVMLPPHTAGARVTRETLDLAKSELQKAAAAGVAVPDELQTLYDTTEAAWKAANTPLLTSDKFAYGLVGLTVLACGAAIAYKQFSK